MDCTVRSVGQRDVSEPLTGTSIAVSLAFEV
jgi:hypothetical protein